MFLRKSVSQITFQIEVICDKGQLWKEMFDLEIFERRPLASNDETLEVYFFVSLGISQKVLNFYFFQSQVLKACVFV